MLPVTHYFSWTKNICGIPYQDVTNLRSFEHVEKCVLREVLLLETFVLGVLVFIERSYSKGCRFILAAFLKLFTETFVIVRDK
jgi:hypothetical protein